MDRADSVHSTPPTNPSAEPPLDGPEKPQDSLYYPTPITPEEAFVAIGRLRKAARAEIERLIDWLDSTDNHMEREPDGDEADASFPESGARVVHPMEDDEDSDTDEDDDPAEPSLGSVGNNLSQEQWATGGTKDLEDEHDGAEPPEDNEPSLGSFDRLIDQDRAWQQKAVWFSNSDAEHDDAEKDR